MLRVKRPRCRKKYLCAVLLLNAQYVRSDDEPDVRARLPRASSKNCFRMAVVVFPPRTKFRLYSSENVLARCLSAATRRTPAIQRVK